MNDMFDRLGSLLNDYLDDPTAQNDFFSKDSESSGKTYNNDKKVKIINFNADMLNKLKNDAEKEEKKYVVFPSELLNDFKILGVPAGSSLEECKNSYKNLLKKYHPDKHIKNTSDYEKATKITIYVTESYRRIKNWYDKKNR